MNIARSTFVRRGCVLTALAAAVLLAASSGTAWAQSTLSIGLSMRASPGTLAEGASGTSSTPQRVTLTITRSGADTYDNDLSTAGDSRTPVFTTDDSAHLRLKATCNGETFNGSSSDSPCEFTFAVKGGGSINDAGSIGGTGATLKFSPTPDTTDGNQVVKTLELHFSHDGDNGDWDEETIGLTLELAKLSVNRTESDGSTTTSVRLRASPRRLTVRVEDDERQPTLKFTPASIQLAEGNTLTMTAGIGVGAGGRGSLPAGIRTKLHTLRGFRQDVLLAVSPAEAVGTLIQIWKDANNNGMLDANEGIEPDGQGNYNIGKIGHEGDTVGAVASDASSTDNGIKLSIKALDVSGFRDKQIMFTLMDGRTEAQKAGEGGPIAESAPATVTVLSGEETPTVKFSKESVTIDEGGTETVHLLADTDQGDQVGSVSVSVRGDATIVLEKGGSRISNGVVDFGGSANAELTVRALGDLTLEDGEEKTATVAITDAGGANIGDPRELMVTVVGSTAVPALPLVGQLLLALLLAAGGARLYRRRQQ